MLSAFVFVVFAQKREKEEEHKTEQGTAIKRRGKKKMNYPQTKLRPK
jgi:hypothetical protein